MIANELIAVGFPDMYTADEVLLALIKAHGDYFIDLEEAAVVVRKETGEVKLRQSHLLAAEGFLGGGLTGRLVESLFLNPLAGSPIKAARTASGALAELGIEDAFIMEIGETIQPGTSALFIFVRHAVPLDLIKVISHHEGKVLHTSLAIAEESDLRKALEAATPSA